MEATMSRSTRTNLMPLSILAARTIRKDLTLTLRCRDVRSTSSRGLTPSTSSNMFHRLLGPQRNARTPTIATLTASSPTKARAKQTSTASTQAGFELRSRRDAMETVMSTPMYTRFDRISSIESCSSCSRRLARDGAMPAEAPANSVPPSALPSVLPSVLPATGQPSATCRRSRSVPLRARRLVTACSESRAPATRAICASAPVRRIPPDAASSVEVRVVERHVPTEAGK
mmetsp:Transcript_56503/g.159360  ORF Transcript_56503/g.159360 Transcript_56503/m.159360 type:complete len:230 (+) Transcript_56503:1-690(+)